MKQDTNGRVYVDMVEKEQGWTIECGKLIYSKFARISQSILNIRVSGYTRVTRFALEAPLTDIFNHKLIAWRYE